MRDECDIPELANYRLLVSRVDELCNRITDQFALAITCRAGCSGCCRHLTLFPVEAAALANALSGLDDPARTPLASIGEMPENGPCPLLLNDRCIAYAARPIICRTHGLPLLTKIDGERRIDFCPDNFRGMDSLPGDAVMNLDLINHTLVTINARYLQDTDYPSFHGKERYSIADIVRMAIARAR